MGRCVASPFEKIISNIKRISADRRISAAELGRLAGISVPQLHHYLNGRNKPGIDKLEAIAKALGVGLDALLGTPPLADAPPRNPTPEELAAFFLEGAKIDPKRKAICLLALTAEPGDIEIIYNTALHTYLEPREGVPANHKKPLAR